MAAQKNSYSLSLSIAHCQNFSAAGKRLFEGSRCAQIVAKWKANCFDKIPACKCPDSTKGMSDYEIGNALENYGNCVRNAELKTKECLEGMNRELNEAHCATMSL